MFGPTKNEKGLVVCCEESEPIEPINRWWPLDKNGHEIILENP